MPAWVVPPPGGTGSRWAVLVHGRGARREETVRALPPLRSGGGPPSCPRYRNDEGVPVGPDSRYDLGLSEWRDVEAATRYAVARGAREVLLVGWSMGGAIVLQFLDRSPLSALVSRVVLDGPVIDWGDVLDHHARGHRLPNARRVTGQDDDAPPVGAPGRRGPRGGRPREDRLGAAGPGELHHPVLLIHSADDEFVPVGPSRALALARPDLVPFEEWSVARHCKEWNTDPGRWESLVAEFAAEVTVP